MKNVESFGEGAVDYAKYRPHYPPEMFSYIAAKCHNRGLALDCATGSGQAALPLVDYFENVIATDISPRQIDLAERHPRIKYLVSAAETVPLAPVSCDLIFVGQALHWFELEDFFSRVRVIGKAGAVFGACCYSTFTIDQEIDRLIERRLMDPIDPFWAEGNRMVFAHYETLTFPFVGIAAPEFAIEHHWSLVQLLGYLQTWSAVKRYTLARGTNPVEALRPELSERWKPTAVKKVTMRLTLRIGKIVK